MNESKWELECRLRSLRNQKNAIEFELYQIERRIAETEGKLKRARARKQRRVASTR